MKALICQTFKIIAVKSVHVYKCLIVTSQDEYNVKHASNKKITRVCVNEINSHIWNMFAEVVYWQWTGTVTDGTTTGGTVTRGTVTPGKRKDRTAKRLSIIAWKRGEKLPEYQILARCPMASFLLAKLLAH